MSDDGHTSPRPAQLLADDAAPVLNYRAPTNEKLVTLTSFGSPFEANLALAKLQANGIHAVLGGELMHIATAGLYQSALGGIRLQVLEQDLERAADLLPKTKPDRAAVCPKCAGRDVERSQTMRMRWLLVVVLLGLPLLFTEAPCRCRACGHYWKPADLEDEDETEPAPHKESPGS